MKFKQNKLESNSSFFFPCIKIPKRRIEKEWRINLGDGFRGSPSVVACQHILGENFMASEAWGRHFLSHNSQEVESLQGRPIIIQPAELHFSDLHLPNKSQHLPLLETLQIVFSAENQLFSTWSFIGKLIIEGLTIIWNQGVYFPLQHRNWKWAIAF